MSMNGNRELELQLRSIAIDAELMADKVANNQLWEGDAKKGVDLINEKVRLLNQKVKLDNK